MFDLVLGAVDLHASFFVEVKYNLRYFTNEEVSKGQIPYPLVN